MDFSVYIGCAITIVKTPTEKVKKTKVVCSNNDKHKLVNGNFCPICGCSKTNQDYFVEEPIDLWELWDENYSDILWYHDDVFLDNRSDFHISIDEYCDINQDLKEFDLDNFKIYAKNFLKVLDEKNVEYKISNIVKTVFN